MFLNILLTSLLLLHSYSTYKLLSQRPAPTEQLESHLVYFVTLALLFPLFNLLDVFCSFIPFYGTLKTLILLVIAIPQTQASAHLYLSVVEPWLRANETHIDSRLDRVKAETVEFGKGKMRDLWGALLSTVGQQSPQTPDPLQEAGPPPTMADPLSGPMQMVSGWWRSYGPAIMAVASSSPLFSQQSTGPAQSQAQTNRTDREQQRARLEAELAALRAGDRDDDILPDSPPVTLKSTPSSYSSSRPTASSSDALRVRSSKGFDETEEEDEDDDEGVGYDYQPHDGSSNGGQQGWLGGWFSPSTQGYERAKAD